MTKEIASVYFVDGCAIERDFVYVASKADMLDPMAYDFSRMFFNDRGEWVYHDLEWDVKSVCVRRSSMQRQYVAMSIQGDVEFQFVGGSTVEKIPNAGTLNGAGAMMQVREIGGQLLACGYGGQVYYRTSAGWVLLGGGLSRFESAERPVSLNSIDGSGLENLYAVGNSGRIFHFDGESWSEIDSPTNVHLERVRFAEGKAYICGNYGTVLQGDRKGFAVNPIGSFISHLWGIERYGGRTYVAHLSGLHADDGIAWSAVNMGLDASGLPEDGYRLDTFGGILWSFGPKRVAYFDGIKWTAVPHPDN